MRQLACCWNTHGAGHITLCGIFKICTESRDIGQNVSNFAGLVWKANFGHFFGNISGLGPYFSKPIFALEP